MRKKLIAVSMSVLFLFSITGTGYANTKTTTLNSATVVGNTTKISKDDASKIAIKDLKDYFNFDLDEKQYQSYTQLSPDYTNTNAGTWNLNWNSFNGASNISISVGIDASSGRLGNMNEYDSQSNSGRPQVAKYTQEQGNEIADKLVEKINPGILKNTRKVKNPYPYTNYNNGTIYTYKYIRVENGIDYYDNNIMIQFDGVSGRVNSYYSNWNDALKFPAKGEIIDSKTAADSLGKELKFKLQYLAYRDSKYPSQQFQGIKLAYIPYFENGPYVDAVTGKVTNGLLYYNGTKKKDLNDTEKKAFIGSYKEKVKADTEMDQTKAQETAKGYLNSLLTTPAAIDFMSYQQNNYNGTNMSIWMGQYNTNSNANGGSISIDTVTGNIISFNTNNFNYSQQTDSFTPKLTWEEAYYKATDMLTKLYPDKLKDIKTEQMDFNVLSYVDGKEVQNPYYSFSFIRTINGIEYSDNSIQISIDARSGVIFSIYCNWDDTLKFPEANKTISIDEATKIFNDNFKLSLGYITYNKSSDSSKYDLDTKLAYVLKYDDSTIADAPLYLDAFTGRIVNYSGEDILNLDNDDFTKKIKGNQYEKEISALAMAGTIDTKNFEVNRTATELDLIKAVAMLKSNRQYISQPLPDLKFTDIKKDDANYKNIQLAVYYGIIKNESKELKLDQKLNRESIIKSLIDLTPYAKLAASKEIFALDYTDANSISNEIYGYVAIAKGLSITDNTIKTFNPKEEVKMDEFAHLIFNISQYITTSN